MYGYIGVWVCVCVLNPFASEIYWESRSEWSRDALDISINLIIFGLDRGFWSVRIRSVEGTLFLLENVLKEIDG